MKIINIPEMPDLDKFTAQIFRYLRDHKFQGEIDYNDLLEQADRAYNAMWDYSVDGHSVEQSLEIANYVLFENVGESEYEVVEEILRDDFKDTVDLSTNDAMNYWVLEILSEVEDLFEECENFKFGISAADVDINRDAIIGRIANFFESYGF